MKKILLRGQYRQSSLAARRRRHRADGQRWAARCRRRRQRDGAECGGGRMSGTRIEYTFIPLAVFSTEDGVYYPHVRQLMNGQFVSERQYIMGFEDEATAKVMANTFASEEKQQAERSIDIAIRSLKR